MKYLQVVFLTVSLVALPGMSRASSVDIGGVGLEIPAPDGFVALSSRMGAMYKMQQALIPSNNRQFSAYVSETIIPEALMGRVPVFERSFSVQTPKRAVNSLISEAQFTDIKRTISSQAESIFSEVEKHVPTIINGIDKSVAESFFIDPRSSTMQFIPIAPHYEDSNEVSWSIFIKHQSSQEPHLDTSVSVGTVTMMAIKGKLLVLYCYAEADGLEWTRLRSRAWAQAIASANE